MVYPRAWTGPRAPRPDKLLSGGPPARLPTQSLPESVSTFVTASPTLPDQTLPHAAAGHAPVPGAEFTAAEWHELRAEDGRIGLILGLLLGGFFVVLVALMIYVNWWTASANFADAQGLPPATPPAFIKDTPTTH